MLNEASFSWVRPWGELTNPYPEVPGITVGGITGYQQGFGPNEFVQNSFEWRDVVTWTRGSHSMKIGGAYTREHADNDSSRTYNRPTYDFNNVFDFAADSPRAQANLGIDPATGAAVTRLTRFHRTQSVSAFVQDDWKVKPNLSVNVGLRYEAFLNIYDASGDMANIVMGSGGDLRSRLQGAHVVERHYYLEGGLWSGGQHTLAPRASFAWDPTKRRADVDPRRHRPLVRSHVEPDLGLGTSQSAGIRDHDRAGERSGGAAGVRPRTQPADAVRLPAAVRD